MPDNLDTDPSTPNTVDDPDSIGYADALEELESILEELEADNVDIDVLSSRVERAALLIGVCRGRIHRAQEQVNRVMESFEDLADPTENGGSAT